MGKIRNYHHGDLRQELLRLALKHINANGVENISIRALARGAGVAHRAAYQHFKDKDALVAAALAKGYERLEICLEKSINKEKLPAQNLISIGNAYALFAFEQRNMFLAMIGPRINQQDIYPDLEAALNRCWHTITRQIDKGCARGDFNISDSQMAAVLFWGGLQGVLAQAVLERIKLNPNQRTVFFETVAQRFIAALRA